MILSACNYCCIRQAVILSVQLQTADYNVEQTNYKLKSICGIQQVSLFWLLVETFK